jgi:hypothetical protein
MLAHSFHLSGEPAFCRLDCKFNLSSTPTLHGEPVETPDILRSSLFQPPLEARCRLRMSGPYLDMESTQVLLREPHDRQTNQDRRYDRHLARSILDSIRAADDLGC